MSLRENIAAVQERIDAAATRAGRSPADVQLMAVSKTHPAEAIREAYDAGLRLFGENRVQEFEAKHPALSDLADARVHLIGHLQTNKVGKAAAIFHAVESIDTLRLAQRLNSAAKNFGQILDGLIEINIGGEVGKAGVAADSAELGSILATAPQLQHLRIRGLMTIPPFHDDPEQVRPYFRRLRELRDEIAARKLPAVSMDQLSMGMSHDFEVAIEEGSTCVRIGTAIFGERPTA
jgi:PLP dependent protein